MSRHLLGFTHLTWIEKIRHWHQLQCTLINYTCAQNWFETMTRITHRDKRNTGFLEILWNYKTHGSRLLHGAAREIQTFFTELAAHLVWPVRLHWQYATKVYDTGKRLVYGAQVKRWAFEKSTRWERIATTYRINLSLKVRPLCQNGKTICPLSGWWKRASGFHSDLKWNAA